MNQPDNNCYNMVRQRLLLCVCVSHGISIDHTVFMGELEYTLSRVFACFFPNVNTEQQGLIYDSLRSEFQDLTGNEIKQLVIQECGYFRTIVWPRIESCLCRILFLIAAPFEIKWIARFIAVLLFPLIWFMNAWANMFEGIAKLILPSRFFENNTVTYHYLSWLPTKPDENAG